MNCKRCEEPITHPLLISVDYGYCSSTCQERDLLGLHFESLARASRGMDDETYTAATAYRREAK